MDVKSGMSLEVQDNGEEYDIKIDLEEAEEELDDSENILSVNPNPYIYSNPEVRVNDGKDAPLIVPSLHACHYNIKMPNSQKNQQLRLQRYDAPGLFVGCVLLIFNECEYYFDSNDLRAALKDGTTQKIINLGGGMQYAQAQPTRTGVRAWAIQSGTVAHLCYSVDYFGYNDWKSVAYDCDRFSKPKGSHYVAARFLDVRVAYKFVGSPRIEVFPPSAPIASELPSTGCLHLIGRAHPRLILDDTELDACVQQVSENSDLRLPVAIYWMNRMGTDPVDHRKLGVHPLGLFTLFIHDSDYDELFDSDYDSSVLDDLVIVNNAVQAVRATNAQLTRRKTSDQTQASDWSTITYLNIAKLTESTGVPRPISQKTVMYGHSASEVAEIFRWTRENRPRTMWHRAEWLHRSAFSFGGLGVQRLRVKSSQQVKNLIFGSVEANTSMIRPETTMKRLATQLSQEIPSKSEANFGVITTSTKPLPNLHPGTNCAWLTSELKYCMRLRVSQISPKLEDLENELYFNPFSRRIPLAFELKLDEVVEKAWLKRELAKAGFDYEKHNDLPPRLRNAGQEVVKFCHYFIDANSRQFDWDRFHNEVQTRANDIVIERPSYLQIPRTRTTLQPLSQEISNALSQSTLDLLDLPNFITHAFSHLQENAKLGYADHEQGQNYSAFTYRLLLLPPQSGLNQFNLYGAIIIIKLISDACGEDEWYGLNDARYCDLAAEVKAVGLRVSRDFVAVPSPM